MPMLEIGSSKQLFFDDYLIESLTRATRGLNQAIKVDEPILQQERPWEGNCMRPQKVIFDCHRFGHTDTPYFAAVLVIFKSSQSLAAIISAHLW